MRDVKQYTLPAASPIIEIKALQNGNEAETCARMMAGSEPWITLRRDYNASLKLLADPSREVYLALVGGRIAGFLILTLHGAFAGYIQSVCVAPDWRGQGIGSQLIAFAEERIFHEMPNVFICVSSFNHGAQKLYERLGYEVVGELKNYVVWGHSEILLRKTIAPLAEFKR
ncbi:MAG: GNAT family N-acetyltransferase [Chloroflexi bacterium]|nr:GNAT family N-acetyltransferase [Chloroflexota bacterium]MCI0579832.1 GNAT family N-acetyltransferase [Chloroflexota bacterium]MCI0646758.1 GNAT family N-acetyltransferase [Chloroflexota bacterium]MCI0728981.1 GNAT family N-acetyltransferase [Chloroflexota bacterium]